MTAVLRVQRASTRTRAESSAAGLWQWLQFHVSSLGLGQFSPNPKALN